MRTNIDIDDELMDAAQAACGHKTKKATVEEALTLLVQMHRQAGLIALRGRLPWTGVLDDLRRDE